MATLGKITTNAYFESETSQISIDESICGFIFDISNQDNVFSGYSLAEENFSDNNVICINNLNEAVNAGITDNGIMNGMPYYHLKQYYDYLGSDKELYIMFADVVTEGETMPIEQMLMASNCRVFQIGVWSDYPMFTEVDVDTIGFSDLVTNINSQISYITGTSDQPSGYPSSVNVILCGGTGYNINYQNLPNCKDVDYRNISILLGQDTSDWIHTKQANNFNGSQVGLLGLAMACMTLAGAEENIGYVANYNLNKSDVFTGIELGIYNTSISIDDINYTRLNELSEKGYIFPVKYDGIEGGIYFNGEDTMSDGDYYNISNNRLSQKCRRIVKNVLIQQVNGPIYFDREVGKISSSSLTILTDSLNNAVDTNMVNKLGQSQLAAYLFDIDEEQDELADDKLKISLTLATLESENELNVVENYKIA